MMSRISTYSVVLYLCLVVATPLSAQRQEYQAFIGEHLVVDCNEQKLLVAVGDDPVQAIRRLDSSWTIDTSSVLLQEDHVVWLNNDQGFYMTILEDRKRIRRVALYLPIATLPKDELRDLRSWLNRLLHKRFESCVTFQEIYSNCSATCDDGASISAVMAQNKIAEELYLEVSVSRHPD